MIREFDKRHEHDLAIQSLRAQAEEEGVDLDQDYNKVVEKKSMFSSLFKVEVCPASEGLCEFFKATRGENWRNKKRWESKPDSKSTFYSISTDIPLLIKLTKGNGVLPERIFGITFRADTFPQVVEEIELSGNHLNGACQLVTYYLSHLTWQ